MNALLVEQGFLAAAAAIYAPLPGYCGTNDEMIDNEDPIVVFLCEECEHKAGPYWTAVLRIEIDSPLLPQEPLVSSAKWTALLDWLDDKATVQAAFAAAAINLNGYFVRSSGQASRDNRWIASITLVAGVEKASPP